MAMKMVMKYIIYVKSLPWCSKQFSESVANLHDIQAASNKSAMAKKQSKKCLVGEASACVVQLQKSKNVFS